MVKLKQSYILRGKIAGGGLIMADVVHALETAGAILFSVIVLIGVVTAVAVKRGEAALAKHH